MKLLDEYRNPKLSNQLLDKINAITTRDHTIMEVCGGQTHSIIKFGIHKLLCSKIKLIHGPGCPVCVTPVSLIDKAIKIALKKNVIFCSFGDMLRVPGTKDNLLSANARGADIRIVYSPTDSLKIAKENPDKQIVFFAIGFETTAPCNAMVVYQAKKQKIKNFSVLSANVLVAPAMEAILSSLNNNINGFLAAGHVCTVMGYREYEKISKKYKIPIVVTGFEPVDILQGIYMCVKQLEKRIGKVENQYARSVTRSGNIHAQQIIKKVFKISDRNWRGIGSIQKSGLNLRKEYSYFDAEKKFVIKKNEDKENKKCISGLILKGLKKPDECKYFSGLCNPEHPLGAPMVSSEGACAAYYNYKNKIF